MAKEGFSVKMLFEEEPKGRKGTSHTDTWGGHLRQKESERKDSELAACWGCSGHSKEVRVADLERMKKKRLRCEVIEEMGSSPCLPL